MHAKSLKCIFLFQNGHPMLCIYDGAVDLVHDDPKELFTTKMTRVDLVHDADAYNSIVRCETKTYGSLLKNKVETVKAGAEIWDFSHTITEVIEFCKKYQDKYPRYSKVYNNCRKFTTLLCAAFNVVCGNPDKFRYEDLVYAAMACTGADASAVTLAKAALK